MPINKLRKFRTLEEVTFFLNGSIQGGKISRAQGAPSNNAPGITGLVGLTLEFTSPSAVTVTFVASNNPGPTPPAGSAYPPGTNPDPNTLFFQDIRGQIETALPGVKVLLTQDQNIVIVEAAPAAGVAISSAGTANNALGFDSSNPTVGKLYTPAVVSSSPPCWVWAGDDNSNMHLVYTWEN